MKTFSKKRRFITLIEMMIVMFLIAMITGVIAYNYTGSLEAGKAFKTTVGMDRIHTALDLHLVANPEDKENIETKWKDIIEQSQLVKNPKDLINDGWGNEYKVSVAQDDIVIESERYNAYRRKSNKGALFSDNNKN